MVYVSRMCHEYVLWLTLLSPVPCPLALVIIHRTRLCRSLQAYVSSMSTEMMLTAQLASRTRAGRPGTCTHHTHHPLSLSPSLPLSLSPSCLCFFRALTTSPPAAVPSKRYMYEMTFIVHFEITVPNVLPTAAPTATAATGWKSNVSVVQDSSNTKTLKGKLKVSFHVDSPCVDVHGLLLLPDGERGVDRVLLLYLANPPPLLSSPLSP